MDNSTDDWGLLQAFITQESHEAFRLIVDRYIGLVFATARRRGCDFHQAQDTTQAVFVILAKKAPTLRRGSPLSLWLYNTSRYTAANAIRMKRARQHHEKEAASMKSVSITPVPSVEISENERAISDMLEDAIDKLKASDRAAILMRFYQGRNYADVGAELGTSAHAAEVKVSRALEKLRTFLRAKGTIIQSAAIGTILAARATDAAPTALKASVCEAVLGKGASAAVISLAASAPAVHKKTVRLIIACAVVLMLLLSIVITNYFHQKPAIANPAIAVNGPVVVVKADVPPQPSPSTQPIILTSGFENSKPLTVTQISPTHLSVFVTSEPTVMDHQYFLFRLDNVKGRNIQINFEKVLFRKWGTLNPVYSYNLNQNDPSAFDAPSVQPAAAFNTEMKGSLGEPLPDTRTQDWHFIGKTWLQGADTFCFSQTFTEDSVLVAMRPPYSETYNERYFEKLKSNPLVKVIQIGKSIQGRPLYMAEIGNSVTEKSKPCIVINAGEHADDEDAMWYVQGIINHLIDNSDDSRHLRANFTFLLIPMMDPDASFSSIHQSIMVGFMTNTQCPETIAYANWFQDWVNAGNRLDIAIAMGNGQAAEWPNFVCWSYEGLGERGKVSAALTDTIFSDLSMAGYSVSDAGTKHGWYPDRFDGWLGRRYGALSFAYEINSQASKHHLNLQQLRAMGGAMIDALPEFFDSPEGAILLANVDARRGERLDRWAKAPAMPAGISAIDAEAIVSKGVGISTQPSNTVEDWLDNPQPKTKSRKGSGRNRSSTQP